ncbi:Glyoxalase/Bleomycin resistance protein/Dihydroxybiphenyl dioxygenase [Kockiozyma suomiensis]|uniref:Glyoxalase/Bleomycin resistance protein/Dihydroxybiphenyl dioxygenase n=1 Tax=Kockiozyma suomiensis TaxID=1337062 RepID=UPI003343FD39
MSADTPFPEGEFLPSGGGYIEQKPLVSGAPETTYRLNHFMIRIRDPKISLPFYTDIMGMRIVFTMNVGPFTIYYLGYPSTDEHRADLKKFSLDTLPVMQHTLGLLELYHVHGSEKQEPGYVSTGNDPLRGLGFGHLGFTVPDVPAAIERLTKLGVKVFKPLGVSSRETIPLSEWEESRGIGKGTIHENYHNIFKQIAFVQDPDGYIVELVPQDL